LDYCTNNTAALPGSGWRLPSVKELQTLVDDSVFPAIPTNLDQTIFQTSAQQYWTSTPFAGAAASAPEAWLVSFGSGASLHSYVDAQSVYRFRCVR
jgi:hypothetical protein